MLDELPDVRVLKVKAHLRYHHVAEGRVPFDHWIGNGIADRWAKVGCDVACKATSGTLSQQCWQQAQEWYRWVTKVAMNWIPDTARTGPAPPPPKRIGQEGPLEGTVLRKRAKCQGTRKIGRNDRMLWCRRCSLRAKRTERVDMPRRCVGVCRGTMSDRCGLKPKGIVHSRLAYDDGARSLDFLHSQLATRAIEDWTEDHRQVNESRPAETVEPQPAASEEQPPPPVEHSDEDPCGYKFCGFDGPVQPACGNTAGLVDQAFPQVMQVEIRGEDRHKKPEGHKLPSFNVECAKGDVDTEKNVHAWHRLTKTAHVAWCLDCGRFAIQRLGTGLLGSCRGVRRRRIPEADPAPQTRAPSSNKWSTS